jgi:hypothetical protein
MFCINNATLVWGLYACRNIAMRTWWDAARAEFLNRYKHFNKVKLFFFFWKWCLKLRASYLISAQTNHNYFSLYNPRFFKFNKGRSVLYCKTPKQEKVTTKQRSSLEATVSYNIGEVQSSNLPQKQKRTGQLSQSGLQGWRPVKRNAMQHRGKDYFLVHHVQPSSGTHPVFHCICIHAAKPVTNSNSC